MKRYVFGLELVIKNNLRKKLKKKNENYVISFPKNNLVVCKLLGNNKQK